LLPHQIQVVKWLKNNRGIVAVHPTGSGKTLTAVTASQCFLDTYPNRQVIVIAPKSLITNFQKELKQYSGSGQLLYESQYVFFSFEKFARLDYTQRRKVCWGNMMIIDEAHQLRTVARASISGTDIATVDGTTGEETKEELKEKENRSLKIINGTMIAEKVLLLTATPVVNESYDLANLVAMVRGEEPLTEAQWKRLEQSGSDLYRHLFGCFHYHSISKTRANKYPDMVIHNTILEMDWDFYSEYSKIEKRDEKILEKYLLGQKPSAFLHGFRTALLKIPDSAKINFTIGKIQDVVRNPTEKIVVYSNFVSAGVQYLAKRMEELNIPYGLITGTMSAKKRQKVVDEYNSRQQRVLFISRAAGLGIDLKETSQMIVLDVPWNKATLDQAIGRVVRYESHTLLPEEKQTVEVFVLYVTKPESSWRYKLSNYWNGWFGKKVFPAVDLILKTIIDRKALMEETLMGYIRQASLDTFYKE
jgi:superfamily II DNA or RNA helicase